MDEILPGLYHWTALHERIGIRVSSYYVADGAGTLIDPVLPEEGLDWFRYHSRPERIVLTNRHHYRHSGRFVEAFDCQVRCHESGLHEFEGGPSVGGFSFGDEVAPRIVALEVDAICPDDTALHVGVGDGALAFADGVIRGPDGSLSFVPDAYMGEDPGGVKRGLRKSVRRLLDRDFDHLLFAHGAPLVGGGKRALRAFVEEGES